MTKYICFFICFFLCLTVSVKAELAGLLDDESVFPIEGTFWCEDIDMVDIPESNVYVYGQQDGTAVIKGWGEITLNENQRALVAKYSAVKFIESSVTYIDMKGENGAKRTKTSPEGITRIGERQFYDGMSFKSVIFPNHLEYIGDYNFPLKYEHYKDMSSLGFIQLSFPESLKAIGSNCFCGGCLKTLTLPPNLESIGTNSFVASVPESLTYMVPNMDYYFSESIYLSAVEAEYKEHPDEFYRIVVINGFHVFVPHYKNQALELSPNLSYIGEGSFACCDFDWVYVPQENEHFKSEDGALYTHDGKCLLLWPKAKHVPSPFYLKEGVRLSNGCFSNTDITEIILPSTLTEIPDYAFDRAIHLKSVVIPESVKRIGNCAFRECPSYNNKATGYYNSVDMKSNFFQDEVFSIRIPQNATYIGDKAFQNRILSLSISPQCHLNYVGEHSFNYSYETDIPQTVRIDELGRWAFGNHYVSLKKETVNGILKLGSVNIQNSFVEISPRTEFSVYHPFEKDAEAFYLRCGTDGPNGTLTLHWDRPVFIQHVLKQRYETWYDQLGSHTNCHDYVDCTDYWNKWWDISVSYSNPIPALFEDLANPTLEHEKICHTLIVPRGCASIYINRGYGEICDEIIEGDFEPDGPQPFREDLVNLKNDWRIFHDSDFPGGLGIEEQKIVTSMDSHYYTLDGLRVTRPMPNHIYIHKGKKIIYK